MHELGALFDKAFFSRVNQTSNAAVHVPTSDWDCSPPSFLRCMACLHLQPQLVSLFQSYFEGDLNESSIRANFGRFFAWVAV